MPVSGLIKILENQVQESDISLSEVSNQLERNYRFYSLDPMGNEMRGRSHYISPDVLEGVEAKKALFRKTFLSSRQVVSFKADNDQSVQEAQAKTAYCNRVIQENDRSRLFSDAWHDAFTAKRCVGVIEWHEDSVKDEMVLTQPTPEQMVMQMITQRYPDAVELDTSQLMIQVMPTPTGMVRAFQGVITVISDASHPEITLVRPERFRRDPEVAYLEDGMWAVIDEDIPRGTLKDHGYDPEQIDRLNPEYRWDRQEVSFSRTKSNTTGVAVRNRRESDQESLCVFKTWTYMNLGDTDDYGEYPDEFLLYEIHWASGEILKWEDGQYAIREVEEYPVVEWTEMKISHAEHGLCEADISAHTQKVQSVLKRLVVDNQQMRNNPRYEAVKNNLDNPRDLLDNMIGGVVWSEQVGSVAPLQSPDVSSATPAMIQMFAMDGERRSGMSSLGRGMNMDAVSNQNADSMIERLTTAGTMRPMESARDWAEQWLVPLCQKIVRMAIEFDSQTQQVEVSGKMIDINPAQWRDTVDMEVKYALTPEQALQHAQSLMLMHNTMMQDQQLSNLYGIQQRHALFDDIFDSLGVADTTKYMIRPDSPEYQQIMMRQQQAQQAMQQAQQDQMEFQKFLLTDQSQRAWAEANSKMMDTLADNEREDGELEWSKVVDMQTLDIKRSEAQNKHVG